MCFRTARIKSSIALVASDIELFVYKPNGQKDAVSLEGIRWGVTELFDIFCLLAEISHTSNLSGSQDEWFQSDLAAVKTALIRQKTTPDSPPEESWYTKFASVASSVLIEFIYLESGVPDVKGRKSPSNDISRRNLLQRVPTASWTSGRYPDFPIDGSSLSDWVSYYADKRPLPGPHTETNLDIAITREVNQHYHAEYAPPIIDHIKRKQHPSASDDEAQDEPMRDLSDYPDLGEDLEREHQDRFEDHCRKNGMDPELYEFEDFTSPASLPLTKMIPQHLTAWFTTFTQSNIYAQAQMMTALIEQERARLDAIKSSCDLRAIFLEGASINVAKELESLAESARDASHSLTAYGKLKEQVAGMEAARVEVRGPKPPLLHQLFLKHKQPAVQ